MTLDLLGYIQRGNAKYAKAFALVPGPWPLTLTLTLPIRF